MSQQTPPSGRSPQAAPANSNPVLMPNTTNQLPDTATDTLSGLAPAQALELFIQDPYQFVRQIVDDAAQMHLADLKEQAELQSALNSFRKQSPEFERLEPFILQEVVTLLREDPEGGSASWERLLEKALGIFSQKFQDTLKTSLNQSEGTSIASPKEASPPFMEAAGKRQAPTEPPRFTRQQIAKMSLSDFLKNESAINEALKNNRVQ